MKNIITTYFNGCSLRDGFNFFRMFLDNNENHEIGVYSNSQTPSYIEKTDNGICIRYDSIVDEFGKIHDIRFCAEAGIRNGKLYFEGTLENNSDVRINELQYPCITFDKTYTDAENEELFYPFGLGCRQKNPRSCVKNAHSEYIFADYKEIVNSYRYPAELSMLWFGMQSDEKFMHFQREDEAGEICAFNLAVNPRNAEFEDDLTLSVSSYPTLYCGEKYTVPTFFTAVFDGDWTKGADCYREWMERSSWYKVKEVSDAIRFMDGWQRIIMKHQYGEIFLTYPELVDLYEEGKQYGIDTLLVFGWWKGRFDNGYPVYEADPEMGGEEALKDAIAEIRRRGGRVILYSNGKLIDIKSDFFAEYSDDVCVKNIDGNFSYECYPFGNNGTFLKNFGYKTFATACFGSDVWQKKLLETTDIKLSFLPDGVFYDQVGGQWGRMPLCFNTKHKHDTRAAQDSVYRIEAIQKIADRLPENVSLGTEYFVDRYAVLFDYIHGCNLGCQKCEGAFPYIMRYIFPETILSNRWTHDEKKGYIDELNYSFVFGMIFDVSIYRGRMGGMQNQPNYSEHIKKLIDIKRQYKKYFYAPTFAYSSELLNIPSGITAAKYVAEDSSLLVCMNETDNEISFSFGECLVSVPPHGVCCTEQVCGK